MAEIKRYNWRRHRSIKQHIAAGRYKNALNELEAERDALIAMLKFNKCNHEEIELRLTRNSSLFAECYSKMNQPMKAEKWFAKALKHCERLKDPVVRERILRVRAVHRAELGRYADAEADLQGVIDTLQELTHQVLTPERMELEVIFSRGRLAQCILMRDPLNERASAELLEAQRLLVDCGKPFYEIEILMACITITTWMNPIRRGEIIARAFAVNSMHVHNADSFFRISDAATIIPVASFVRSGVGRLGF